MKAAVVQKKMVTDDTATCCQERMRPSAVPIGFNMRARAAAKLILNHVAATSILPIDNLPELQVMNGHHLVVLMKDMRA